MENKLYHGDCLEIMPTLPDSSVDLVLCDLPYGTTAQAWDKIISMEKLWREYARLIKPNGTIALFCTQPFTSKLVMCQKYGGVKWRYMWVWIKNNKTGYGNAKKQPLRQYEEIAIFGKRAGQYHPRGLIKLKSPIIHKPRISENVYHNGKNHSIQTHTNYPTNILRYDVPATLKRFHPNEKPIELLKYLIKTYTDKGDLVLDNTMGSGSTCVAAKMCGRKYIGIEYDARYYDIACQRVAEAEEQIEMEDSHDK